MKDGKYVILCVDDDADFLESSQIFLEANDYIVETAPSAEDGLKKFRECNPDLIIVDLMMEEVDAGTNLAKELKLVNNTAPVYMLSSVGDQLNMTTNYSELGLRGVFQKPLDTQNVLKTIKSALGQ
ncbi:MAG: response regulator [Deltaproteobacteria bacterium]|nr:response regulator [Deltaproteobacteria bacterium]